MTALWALFLGFGTLRTELVPELDIVEDAYEGMAVFATPFACVLFGHIRLKGIRPPDSWQTHGGLLSPVAET